MKISNHLLIEDENSSIQFKKSPNQSTPITPIYLIMHYTAGTTLDGTVSWFLNPEAKASAHLVIGRDGKICQMVSFNKKAWHAGKSSWGNLNDINQYSIGIEMVNSGKLRKRSDGNWVNWSNNIIPSEEVTIAKHKNENEPTGWHEYTDIQINSAIKVASLLNHTYHFTGVVAQIPVAGAVGWGDE